MKRQKNVPVNSNSGSNGSASAEAPSEETPDPPAPGAPEPQPAVAPELPAATPEERLAALASERDEMKDRWIRTAAEFENWKKRARKEQTDSVAEARERVLKDMLEVVDYLE